MWSRVDFADVKEMVLLTTFLTFAAVVTVKQQAAPLRSGGCDVDSLVISNLDAGSQVEVRSSIAGSGAACYRVMVRIDGKLVSGNLSGADLSGIEEFDRARQAASGAAEGVQVTTAQVESLRKALIGPSLGASLPVQRASALLEQNQPSRALDILSPLTGSGNPDVLVLAGIAAWKSDQVRLALEHWRTAQGIRPMPELAAMIARVEKEVAHDKSGEKLVGLRVALRYENQALPYATAKAMLGVLDTEVTRIADIIGCPSHERLVAIVQSPEDYRQGSSAAEWSGGQFDGRIRVPVPVGATQMDDRMRTTFAHEVTHACLANLGSWPAWLHEGLAQKLSGSRLTAEAREEIRQLAAGKQLPKLQEFRQDWSRMSIQNARTAYAVALAAAEQLVDHYGTSIGLRTILSNPEILTRITGEINKRLELE